MQPSSREMGGMTPMGSCVSGGGAAQIGLQELQNGHHQQQQQIQGGVHFDHSAAAAAHEDFFDQMLSSLPSWPELGGAASKSPWDLANAAGDGGGGQKLFGMKPTEDSAAEGLHYTAVPYDESTLLASRLRQSQISGGVGQPPTGKPMVLQLNQQQMLHPRMGRTAAMDAGGSGGGELGLLPLPLSLGSGGGPPLADVDASFKAPNSAGAEGLYNGFSGSLQRAAAQAANQPHFHHPQGASIPPQNFGAAPSPAAASQAPAAGPAGGAAAAPPRQRVRARRGQATDPHSIAERLRRERIAERMKALQELVPNANKTDKASMLDEIIDYVKFLQLQVKVLSMSRLGGAAAVAPPVADISSEGQAGSALGRGASSSGGGGASDSMTVTEHQVAKLMEEDMGSAMQYLQGKGLCLMPISLASAISSATCHPRSTTSNPGPSSTAHFNLGLIPPNATGGGDNPSSPSMSVLTVQSAMANGAAADASSSAKDAASISMP